MNETNGLRRNAGNSFECAALLFDMDGVLVDSSPVILRSWTSWARRHGVDETLLPGLIHGRKARDVIQILAPRLDADTELAVLIRQEIEDTEGAVAFEGAKSLLRSLPENRWAVVTSAPRAIAISRFEQLGLPIPRVLITAEDVAHGKPMPEGYLNAAAHLGFSPADCVVIEDSQAGIAAGLAASMRVLAVATTHPRDALAHATWRAPAVKALTIDVGDVLRVRFDQA